MLNILALILALVFMSGVIAYTGDWLGSVVGKRRLSLFGARPKQTGRIIGILAGILIMLVTLGTLALAFRNAVRVLFNAQAVAEQLSVAQAETRNLESQRDALSEELQAAKDTIASAQKETERAIAERDQAEREYALLQSQQAELQARIAELQGDVGELEGQLETTRALLESAGEDLRTAEEGRDAAEAERAQVQAELARTRQEFEALQGEVLDLQRRADELSVQNQALSERNDALVQTNGLLEVSNETLRADIAAKNGQLDRLARDVDQLSRELEDSAQALQEAEYRLAAIDSGDLTYGRLEVVDTGVLRGQDANTLRVELAQLLARANENTARRRAGRVELLPEQIDGLIGEALETPGDDIVTLRSAANHFGTEPIRVEVESAENRQLVGAGQLVVSRQLHLGTRQVPAEREQVRTTLIRLQREARDRLLGLGLSDAVSPALGEASLEVDGFANQLLRLSGPVTVGLAATVDIFGSGPATLEFVIVN